MNLFSSGTPDIGMLSNLMQMFSGTSSDVLHQTDNTEQTNDSEQKDHAEQADPTVLTDHT